MFVIRHRSADWYNQYGGNNERFAEPSAVPGTGITAAGQRNLNNSFVVDGLSANDAADLAGAFFSPDVIREFLAVTSGGIAEFGRASSGIVNILTQSDSNLCRGSAYGYLRNQRFDGTNISLKEEVCEDSCLIEIRRCKMAPSDVVRSWHGAPEVDITPELGRWEPLTTRLQTKTAADFSYAKHNGIRRATKMRLLEFLAEFGIKPPSRRALNYHRLLAAVERPPVSRNDDPPGLGTTKRTQHSDASANGSWRLPNKEEAEQLAKLREAGTLRRIERFANPSIDGVPVADKDRPGSDVDLVDWLRQCRRAGLFERGKAIYEKGGLNAASLTDEQQIEAEADYRICARRGSSEEAKPKRQRRYARAGEE